MAADYGHFADGSSVVETLSKAFKDGQPPPHMWRNANFSQQLAASALPPARLQFPMGIQLTPSFFCRLDDDVVYWNTSRLSG